MTRDETPIDRAPAAATSTFNGNATWRTHLTLVVGLAFCVAAFWFELHRAESGNSLSWAYVFEWPLLGGFAIYMWWKVLHPDDARKRQRQAKLRPELAPEFDSMRAGWEQQQRELNIQRQSSVDDSRDESPS